MHADSQIFGRGGWHKAHDFAFASGCPNGHALITAKVNDEMERERKFFIWLRAFVKTWEWIWENRKVKVA
jgi:hypothetical protein